MLSAEEVCQPILLPSQHDCRLQGSTLHMYLPRLAAGGLPHNLVGTQHIITAVACCRSAVRQSSGQTTAFQSVVACCRWAGTQSCGQRNLRWRWSMRTAASPGTRLQWPTIPHKLPGRGVVQPADKCRHLSCAGRLFAQHWLRHLTLCSRAAQQQAAALHAHCTFYSGKIPCCKKL